jgi:hypothetical protein
MQINKILIVLAILGIGVFVWNQKQVVSKKDVAQTETIKIVSTSPEPLEEATILPNQTITVTFNKPIDVNRLKIHLEPAAALEIAMPSKDSLNNTLTINFKESLQLGSGYTLFINADPANKEKLPLEKDYIFHFKTISYKGV